MSMDMERTMQFIVNNLADLTVKQQQADIRMSRMERQLNGIQTIVKTGMKILVKLEQAQKRTDAVVKELGTRVTELTAHQKRTDEKFDRWLDSMNKGSNGHKKKPN
jgi:hypothetical protein